MKAMMTKLIDLTAASDVLTHQLAHPIVFTNGVFDLLHVGHVTYLRQARLLGNSLFVAINSDASARRLSKGPGRPVNTALDRANVIAALESVTAVGIFDEDKPCDAIRAIQPDIYVKGGDYDMEQLEETAIVRSWGGTSIAMEFVEGYSTSAIVNRVSTDNAGQS